MRAAAVALGGGVLAGSASSGLATFTPVCKRVRITRLCDECAGRSDDAYCSGTVWSFKAGNGRLSAPTVAGRIGNLSSFGEDGNGELYATSLDGSLYRLR